MDLDSDYYSSRCKDMRMVFDCVKGLIMTFVGVRTVIIKQYSIFNIKALFIVLGVEMILQVTEKKRQSCKGNCFFFKNLIKKNSALVVAFDIAEYKAKCGDKKNWN